MHLIPLLRQDDLHVSYDVEERWLYADWHGVHTQASTHAACEQMLACLRRQPCTKVLNDNSNSQRIEVELTDWGRRWLADMHRAGMRHLAWVYPHNFEARRQAEKLLQEVAQPVVATFDDLASAYEWLRRQ